MSSKSSSGNCSMRVCRDGGTFIRWPPQAEPIAVLGSVRTMADEPAIAIALPFAPTQPVVAVQAHAPSAQPAAQPSTGAPVSESTPCAPEQAAHILSDFLRCGAGRVAQVVGEGGLPSLDRPELSRTTEGAHAAPLTNDRVEMDEDEGHEVEAEPEIFPEMDPIELAFNDGCR